MNLFTSEDPKQSAYMRREVALKHGEVVTVEIDTVDVVGTDENGIEVYGIPYKKERKFYIGKMNLRQTADVVSVLATVFLKGTMRQDQTKRRDNAVFFDALSPREMEGLLASILELDADDSFVEDNYDIDWALQVIGVFFKYNNFFAILDRVMTMLADMGLTEEAAQRAIQGKTPKVQLNETP